MSSQDHYHRQQQFLHYSNCQCRPTSQNVAKVPHASKFPPTPIKTRGGNRISTTFGGSGSISGGSTSSFSTTSTPPATGSPLSPLVETSSYSPSLNTHTKSTSTPTLASYSFPTHPLDQSPPPKLSTKYSPLASPTLPSNPNPLKSGTFGLDQFLHTSPTSPISPTSSASPASPASTASNTYSRPMEYFPPFDAAYDAPPTSPLSPLNRDDNDIIRNKQRHDNANHDSNDNDNNDYDTNANINTRSNSISFPSRKERHTFGYDDHHHGPPSFLGLPSSPGVTDYERIHPLDPSPSKESPPPSPLHPPTSLYTTPTHPRPLSPPPKNIKRPVVSPTFVHDQHLASPDAPPPTSSYRPSVAHRNHPNNNKYAHGTHSTPRVNSRCSMNMTMTHNSNNDILTSSQPNNHASDTKPNSKSALPKRRKRFSFFANAFSNSTAPMTTSPPHSHSHSSVVSSPTERASHEDRSHHHHHHHHHHNNPPRYDILLLPSLQARPSTSLSHRVSHNTLSSQTDPDFLSSAPVSSKKHLSQSSSSTSPRSRPCSPLTPVGMSLSSSIVAPSQSQGGLTVQVQDHWRWSNASTRAIYDHSDAPYSGGDAATFPEGQSAVFASLSSPTSPSSSVYPGSMLPYAVHYGPGSQESLVIEAHPQQQEMQMQMHEAGSAEKAEGKQIRHSRSASVKSSITETSMEEKGRTKMQESYPPPSSPRPSSSQDRLAKKKCKGLSIFCFFIKK